MIFFLSNLPTITLVLQLKLGVNSYLSKQTLQLFFYDLLPQYVVQLNLLSHQIHIIYQDTF